MIKLRTFQYENTTIWFFKDPDSDMIYYFIEKDKAEAFLDLIHLRKVKRSSFISRYIHRCYQWITSKFFF